MKKYDKYKDSGYYFGEIPDVWDVTHLGFHINTIVPQRDKPKRFEGNIPWIRIEDFNGKYISDTKSGQYVNEEIIEETGLRVHPEGTVLCSCSCSMGATAIVKRPLISNQTFIGLVPKGNLTSDFLYYYMQTAKDELTANSVGAIQLYSSKDDFKQLRVPLPSIKEQTTIASYLDHKTTQIDTLIEKKEQLIEKLKLQRQAIINEAVTKGLSPDAPMKDSGIEWLGEIPEHWEAVKLKYLATITRGAILRPVDEPSYFDDNGKWTYLNISDATKCDKYLQEGKLRLSELGSTKSARVEPNNLIITASATIGKPFINKIPVCVHDGFIPITNLKCDIDFLYQYIGNPQLYVAIGKSNTQKNIYLDEVKEMIIALPPEKEQKEIASFLETKNISFSQLTNKLSDSIEKLKLYRQSIISEAVTGKIDVRGWEKPE